MAQAKGLFASGQYARARDLYELARQNAISAGDRIRAARALGNEGSCDLAQHQFRSALQCFQEAHRLAEAAGDPAAAAPFDANIAMTYGELGEVDAAVDWLHTGIRHLNSKDRRDFLPAFQLEMATLLARQNRMPVAKEFFREAIIGADQPGSAALNAMAWHHLGEESLREHDLPAAERALLEGFRLRELNHLPVIQSYHSLGELRLQQGNLSEAEDLLDRAVDLAAEPRSAIPVWQIFSSRGRVRLAQGRLREALDDLRLAVRVARVWRWAAPADDFTDMGTSHVLSELYGALVDAGNRLYLETGDPALARETFEASEENRAANVRSLLTGRGAEATDLPPAYWTAMSRLERAEVAALHGGTPADQPALQSARAEVVRMESTLPENYRPLPARVAAAAQSALGEDTVLFSFRLGVPQSWIWCLERDGLTVYPLPPKDQIQQEIQQLAQALQENSSDFSGRAAHLYRTLFGFVPRKLQNKPNWLLALDQSLEQPVFDIPLAALVEDSANRSAYLVERHSIEVIPCVSCWLEAARRPSSFALTPTFVGLGDAIYNSADPRAAKGWSAGPPAVALPRLAASGAELKSCARAWNGEHVLLEGPDATRERLTQALQRRPAVVHFATHMLESSDRHHYGLIALSLSPRNESVLLPPLEIATWNIRAGVVVLNGCHAAAGERQQSSGLMSLTRAWLKAGAESVVASRWRTPDDEGPLFRVFYASLRSSPSLNAGRALRAAQVEMIRSGGRYSEPRYWGAWFAVGNQ